MSNQKINSINIGKPIMLSHSGKQFKSGILKKQVSEPVYLGKLNFQGDEQADLIHHGGEDKAVCVYPYEHYSYWEKTLNQKLEYGAFGENLTVTGLKEESLFIGDILQIGEVVVQVSQPRQPCYKLSAIYDNPDLPKLIEKTGYTGYYFRVLKEGIVDLSSSITIIKKHPQKVSLKFANQIMHHDKENKIAIKQILAVDALSTSWRKTLEGRLNG